MTSISPLGERLRTLLHDSRATYRSDLTVPTDQQWHAFSRLEADALEVRGEFQRSLGALRSVLEIAVEGSAPSKSTLAPFGPEVVVLLGNLVLDPAHRTARKASWCLLANCPEAVNSFKVHLADQHEHGDFSTKLRTLRALMFFGVPLKTISEMKTRMLTQHPAPLGGVDTLILADLQSTLYAAGVEERI